IPVIVTSSFLPSDFSDSGIVTTCSGGVTTDSDHRDHRRDGRRRSSALTLNPAVLCRAFWSPHVAAVTEYAHDQIHSSPHPLPGSFPAALRPGTGYLQGRRRQVPGRRRSGGPGLGEY